MLPGAGAGLTSFIMFASACICHAGMADLLAELEFPNAAADAGRAVVVAAGTVVELLNWFAGLEKLGVERGGFGGFSDDEGAPCAFALFELGSMPGCVREIP